jgi:hypothetical protein
MAVITTASAALLIVWNRFMVQKYEKFSFHHNKMVKNLEFCSICTTFAPAIQGVPAIAG